MKVALSSDHRGYQAKERVKAHLEGAGFAVLDCGCDSPTSCDYPDHAVAGAKAIAKGEADLVFSSAARVSACPSPPIRSRAFVLPSVTTS